MQASRPEPSPAAPRPRKTPQLSNAEQSINEEARGILAFLDAMVPGLYFAEGADALLRRKMGTGFRIAKYAVNGELSINQILGDSLTREVPMVKVLCSSTCFVQMLPGVIRSDTPERTTPLRHSRERLPCDESRCVSGLSFGPRRCRLNRPSTRSFTVNPLKLSCSVAARLFKTAEMRSSP